MSWRAGGTYSCKCGALYYAPRSLVRHLQDTGHERDVPSGMIARRYPPKASDTPRSIKITLNIAPKMAAYLRARAMREGTTFSEQVRCHVEWGQEAVEMEAAE